MELKKRTKAAKKPVYNCSACGEHGIVDFLDMVRGKAEIHCSGCFKFWVEEVEAKMSHLAGR